MGKDGEKYVQTNLLLKKERMILMPSIDGGTLLTGLYKTTPVQPVQKAQSIEKTEESTVTETDIQKIVSDELSHDRYDSSMSSVDSNSQTALLEQAGRVAKSSSIADLENIELHQMDSGISASAGPVRESTKTVGSNTADSLHELTRDQNEVLEQRTIRQSDPDVILQVKQKQQEETLVSHDVTTPRATTQHDNHYENPIHKQTSVELDETERLLEQVGSGAAYTQLKPTNPESYMPEPVDIADQRAEAAVKQSQERSAHQTEQYIQEETKKSIGAEIDSELIARQKAQKSMRSGIPTEAKASADVHAQDVVSSKFGTSVADQQVDLKAQPSVTSVMSNNQHKEAFAKPQEMLEHYKAVDTHTQPEVEVDLSRFEAPEAIETPVPVELPEVEVPKQDAAPVEREPVSAPVPTPEPVVQETVSQVEEGTSTTAQTAQVQQAEVAPVTDFFPELPGSGNTELSELPGDDAIPPEMLDPIPTAEDFFPPLPGGGNEAEQEYFAPLPGSGESDGTTLADPKSLSEFLEENPMINFDTAPVTVQNEPEAVDFFNETVTQVTGDELAYMRTQVAASQQNMLETQFGGLVGFENETEFTYDPFEVQNEDWFKEALNYESTTRYTGNISIAEASVDLTQFQDTAIAKSEDSNETAAEFILENLDRVKEYTVESTITDPQELEDFFING